jgi:hypothetical protein
VDSRQVLRAATTLWLCAVGSLLSTPQASAWTTPRLIAEHQPAYRNATPTSLAVDDGGRWHLVYGERVVSGARARTSVRYLRSGSRRATTIATVTSDLAPGACDQVGAPSIAADREGGLLHVSFQGLSCDCSAQQAIMYARSR